MSCVTARHRIAVAVVVAFLKSRRSSGLGGEVNPPLHPLPSREGNKKRESPLPKRERLPSVPSPIVGEGKGEG